MVQEYLMVVQNTTVSTSSILAIVDNKDKFDILGLLLGLLDFHSNRKGYTTMVDVGCTVYPP